jgi:Zn-dependent M28 family amino/carboxypeptidase
MFCAALALRSPWLTRVRARATLQCALASLLLAACTGPVRAPATTSPAPDALTSAEQVIGADYLRAQVAAFASDYTEGRGPATEGDRRARAYLAAQLGELGLAPGLGAEGWEQPVELLSVTPSLPPLWEFEHAGKRASFRAWDDFIAGSGQPTEESSLASAELVFVGYGIEAPEYGWDDFKGRDLRGKVLVMLNNDPDWDPALFAGSTRLYYGRWTYKYESAARRGAVGAIIIHTTPSAGYPFQVVRTSWGGARFELAGEPASSLAVRGWLSEEASRRLLALSGHDLDALTAAARSASFTPVALGTTTSLRFTNQVERKRSANVYGVLRGRDPALADEYVVLSAHHDHFGVGKPDARGDQIYNGALDNGAGVAQVLAITKALAALPAPPRRSVLVLFVAAEEQGLLGSRYFAEHPPVPAGKLAANLNYDGGNIWGRTRDITQIGRGKSSLDAVVTEVAQHFGRRVEPDQFPDRGSFYRSDQFNFAKVGVPALYTKTGTDFEGRDPAWGREQILAYEASTYHQPSDELTADWNFDGMVDDARFGFRALCAIADADSAPSWLPGDEFEAARKRALSALEAPVQP